MKKITKLVLFIIASITCSSPIFGDSFNSKLTDAERAKLNKGELVIRNIDYPKYMCLNENEDANSQKIVTNVKNFNPKYLAEVIIVKDYKGNEDLPKRMSALLNNIDDYAGIPYWSERNQKYYDLYSSSTITSKKTDGNKTTISADLIMEPFGLLQETIVCEHNKENLLYTAENTNDLKYSGITCVGKGKFKVYIYCVHKDDKWIIYGIGGVNAPHIPFMTDRIRTSFINRVKTFCTFIFKKL